MNSVAKSFIIVSLMLFVSAVLPIPHLQAAIFEGSMTEEDLSVGYCLTNPGDTENCGDVDCATPAGQNDLRCMTETQAGTGLARTELATTGITHTEDFGDFVKKLVNFALPYLVLAAFVGYVVAGFMYVTAFGNEEQVGKAKKILIWVSIGLILVMLSYAIVNLLTGELVEGLGGGAPASSPVTIPQPSNPNI